MQFIEKNAFNVRSAVYQFEKPGIALKFAMFPMIHVGSKQFYSDVRQRLLGCDLILAEGVRSKRASLITLSYRIVRRIKRLDLVTQQEALDLADVSDRIILSDIGGKAFDARWKELAMMVRLQLFFFVPIYVLYLLLFGTRALIAENIATDDLASRDEILNYDEGFGKMDSLLIDERDRILIRRIDSVYEARHNELKVVGILYGALHMRNAALFLYEKLGYRIIKSEWLTVFDL
jgi:hypothetical protein